jgi:acetyl-CoA acetyltransferase family protein
MVSMYIVDGTRTPFCKIGTNFEDQSASILGISAVKNLLVQSGIDSSVIDEVIFGCVSQPADTMNIARVISVLSNIPESVPAVSVHRNCASGFEAITSAYEKAQARQGDVFVVGGVENMSRMPFLYPFSAVKKFTALSKARTITQKIASILNFRPKDFSPEIGIKLGLSDIMCNMNMGQTAELLAREFNISREDQDIFAENSHQKALFAENLLKEEISPMYTRNDDCIKSFKGTVVDQDNGPREDSIVSKLSRLRPVFDRKGTVTAGNSSQITDGAAALLLMTRKGLKKTGCKPMCRITSYAYAGCEPKRMGLGPVHAIKKIGRDPEEADLIEINEAFAAQTIAVQKSLNIPNEKLNVNGGAIALGHPVGASGTRLILTLVKELQRQELKTGLASLCIGGGQGGAIWLERC